MATLTTDKQSGGMRKVQRYSVAGGIAGSKASQESTPVEFLLLKNCLVDKRLGAVLKKPGSVSETITGTLGVPLGLSEHIAAANDSLIPIRRTVLANFAGSLWRKNIAGVWSDVSVDSDTSFATSKSSSFCQLGNRLYIAAGLPAYWEGGSANIKRIGIIAPASQATITSSNTGTGITLVSGTRYVYTYYNSSSGLESDWSTPSDAVGVIANKSIVIGIPVATATNWDKIRIYRYLDGGSYPYLVDTVNSGTTSYADVKPDAQLTSRASKRYDKAVPVAQSYICANYAQHLWFVDATDPYKLVFSQPYTGANQDAEYFPSTQNVRCSDPVTGLLVTSSRMLVFHPRSISIITGSNKDEFDLKPLIPGIGTVFAQSIATNGSDIVFLSEEGFVSVSFGNGNRIHLSREIDLDLQPLLAGSYNSAIYASSVWNPSLRQFIFVVSALSSASALWEEVGSGSTATATSGWETTPGAATDTWEDVSSATSTTSTRVKVWGWSPELSNAQSNLWMEYTFPVALDENSNGAYITCLVHPSPSSDVNDPQQDKTFIGLWNGSFGSVLTAFRRDTNTDSGAAITSELITGRVCPGNQDGGYKMFLSMNFTGAYPDPSSDGSGTLKYLIDYEDPHLRNYAANLITLTGSEDSKTFTTALGRHIHLYLTDTSQSQSKILLSEFFINYRERFRKEGR